MQGLQRDVKYHEEKVREYDKKIRQLEHGISEEIQLKERARLNLQVRYIYTYSRYTRSAAILRCAVVARQRPPKQRLVDRRRPVDETPDRTLLRLGFREKTGARVERRVLRDGAPQSGNGDPQGRGARARGESAADEERERRDAVDRRRGGFQDVPRRAGPRYRGEGAAAEAAVRSASRHRSFASGTTVEIFMFYPSR